MTQPANDPDTLRRLLEQAASYILLTDLDMKIQYVNRTSHGYEIEKVVGSNYLDYLGPDQRPRVESAFVRARETGEMQLSETVLQTPDGSRMWLSTETSLMRDEEDRPIGFFNVCTDVTARRQAEQELEKTRKELLEASHRAGMAEVATGVLHNIGDVLGGVSAAAQVADDRLKRSRGPQLGEMIAKLEQPPPDLARYLREDEQGTRFPQLLRDLAGELLDEREGLLAEIARVKHQVELMQTTIAAQQAFAKADVFVQETELPALIDRVVSIFRIEIESRGVEVTRDVQPAAVTLDTQAALQILAGLVRNAVEAMAGPEIPARRLALSARVEDGRVHIEVADTGCGIDQATQARMFQHGFTTKANGHGFGLHAAAIAAQAMGGSLSGHSDGPGRGARFRLDLPDRTPAAPPRSTR